MTDNRMKRERTDRGTTFTLSGGTKISFSDVSKSELHDALEKLYTIEQVMDEGRLVKVVHGEWVVCGDGENVSWICSHCRKTTAHKYKVMYGKFCPNCGAKMDGE